MFDPRRLHRKTERRLEQYYAARPRPGFENELEHRLMEAVRTMQPTQTQRPANRTRRVFQMSLSLAGLALLVIVMALALQTRPQPAVASPTVAIGAGDTPALTPPNFPTATPTPAAFIAPRRLLPGLCPQAEGGSTTPSETQSSDPFMEHHAQGELGSGEVNTGDFTFDLRLVCDPAFRPDSPDYQSISEFEYLGIASAWRYHGESVQGETAEYAGLQPYVSKTSVTGPALDNGSGAEAQRGLQFPASIFIDYPAGDLTFSYILKVYTPDNRWAGAELRFTLRPEAEGYRPADVIARPLDPAELAAETTPAADSAPAANYTLLPTRAPDQVEPALGKLAELITQWESQTLNSPGWLHRVQRVENERGSVSLSNGAEVPGVHREEDWYLLDQNGYVQRSISRLLDEEGSLLQVSVISDGQFRNLTFGDSGPFGDPWRPDLYSDFYSDAARAVRQGVVISQTMTVVDGIPAAQFVLDYSGYRTRIALDAQSGQPLVNEHWSSPGPGEPMALDQRTSTLLLERVDAPPPEMLSLFDATPQPFRPADPVGTPAPEGFDPSSSYIGMKMIVADSPERPSTWFGDLYALPEPPAPDGILSDPGSTDSGYLLGRVDFGAVAGGWCDRSADGSRLAFNWTQPGTKTISEMHLRWLDLSAPGQVYDPDPELKLHSPVAFAPTGYKLAVFACKQETCGLYFLEAGGENAAARLLTPELISFAPPTWKPDGSQIASEGMDSQGNLILTIVDAETGAIIYQGPRSGSPFDSWDAAIVKEQTSFGGCVAP